MRKIGEGILGLVIVYLVVSFLCSCAFASTPTPTPLALIPSAPFVAMSDQGRPLVGASINVSDQFGNQVIACVSATLPCTQLTTVPPSGIVQFFAAAGTYNVVVSGAGISRNYVALLPAGASGGGGIASINGLTDAAIVLNNDVSGNVFSISEPDSSHVTFHWPYASGSADGIISHVGQFIGGVKSWIAMQIFNVGISVNASQSDNQPMTVATNDDPCMISVDGVNDEVNMGTCDGSLLAGRLNVVSTNFKTAIVGQNNNIGSAIIGTSSGSGYAVQGITLTGNTQAAIDGQSSATGSMAGFFTRSQNGATVPITKISRNAATDTQPFLQLVDLSASTTAQFGLEYKLNGTDVWGATSTGKFLGTVSVSAPTFAFLGDTSTGLGSSSGEPCLVDEGNALFCLDNNTGDPFASLVSRLNIVVTSTSPAISVTNLGASNALSITSSSGHDAINTDSSLFRVNHTGVVVTSGGIQSGNAVSINDSPNATTAFTILSHASQEAIDTDSGSFILTHDGEVRFIGISGDGTGKVACVKSDGFVGTCTTVVDSSGVCTCA